MPLLRQKSGRGARPAQWEGAGVTAGPGAAVGYDAGQGFPMSTAAALEPFLRDLAAALPQAAFWSAPVIVGASGGGDSTALLLGLSVLAALRPVKTQLIVAHSQHDLRAEAPADRDAVAAMAGELGLPFVTRQVAVRATDGIRGEGLESRARRLRYRFLEDVARESGARHVAVAHTADDQAETILHRALRGTGLTGLAGMPQARELCDGVALVRPLLHMSRAAVREWLVARGVAWCEDASNLDPRHARNFLRHEILAPCATGPYPAAAAALVRLGDHAMRSAAALASAADHLLESHSRRHPDGTVVIQAAPLARLDPHLLAEVCVAVWRREGWPQRDMTSRHYRSLAALIPAASDPGPGTALPLDLPGGVRAEPTAGRTLTLRPAHGDISTRR